MRNTKSKNITAGYLLFMMALGGVVGFLLSSHAIPRPDNLTFNPRLVYDYDLLFGVVGAACIFLAIWSIVGLVRFASKPGIEPPVSEDGPTARELAVGKLLKISAYHLITAFSWFALCFAYVASREAQAGEQEVFLLVNLLSACGFTVLGVVLQSLTVRHYNKLFPNRSINMRSRSAQREFFDKLDEAERFIVYRSAYSSFKAVNRMIIGGVLFFIVYSLLFEFTPLPILVLAVISIVQHAVYFRESSKLGK